MKAPLFDPGDKVFVGDKAIDGEIVESVKRGKGYVYTVKIEGDNVKGIEEDCLTLNFGQEE